MINALVLSAPFLRS